VSRILQVANFVAPHSGGIRTVLANLADGYADAGHEVIQVVPGIRPDSEQTRWGRLLTLRGIPVPGSGYRLLPPRSVAAAADRLAPDRLEVHDRTTLRGLGQWAARRGVPSCVVSHERLDRLLEQWLPATRSAVRYADRSNARLAAGFDTVICTTAWAAEEFVHLHAPNVYRIPLGVDLARFTPQAADPALRARLAPDRAVLLVLASRLSPEKRPDLAVQTVAELVRRQRNVVLAVAGDGPLRARLRAQSRDLPIRFLGFLAGTEGIAPLLATADLALAPGPVETFGLSALEALACGTPVVANARSAVPEILGAAGRGADATPSAFADAVQELLDRPESTRRAAARTDTAGIRPSRVSLPRTGCRTAEPTRVTANTTCQLGEHSGC
jgi:alpha-1,6-mannosyltransferase